MLARVLVTGLAVAALALAQGQYGGGGGGYGPPGGEGGGRGGMGGPDSGMGGPGFGSAHPAMRESKAEQVANRLKLNNDQRSEFNTIIEATQKDAASVVQNVLKCQQDIANAMLNNKTDAEMAPLKQALAEADFQMTGVEVKTFQKIVALLKPNQMSRAPEAFDLMGGIFLHAGGGRGGWGR